MINGKVKIFWATGSSTLEKEMNEFLKTIDIRQVIKTDFSTSDQKINAIIYYVGIEDIRDAKIENVLEVR